MYRLIFILLLFLEFSCVSNRDVFELSSNQSMCMVGKGPGQDGAINPFQGERSYAIIRNKGDYPLGIRIQRREKILQIKEIESKKTEKILLEIDETLYFDSEYEGKVILGFKKAK